MSYDLYVTARNNALAKQMADFMDINFKPWSEIVGNISDRKCGDFMSKPALEDGKLNTITIWYSAAESEREYAWTLIHWIAIKIGKKAAFWKKKGLPSIPWFSYARCEAFPVIPAHLTPEEVHPDLAWAAEYDELGCRRVPDEIELRLPDNPLVLERLFWRGHIRTELERLNQLWSGNQNE